MQEAAGFTLTELLIVVSIIGILSAIAVPNFLEAQTRSKVARVNADFRALANAIESYRVDNNEYPEETDNPSKYPEEMAQLLGPLASGYYTFRTREGVALSVGRDFANVTTPVAYITTAPSDLFARQVSGVLTYCCRNAKDMKNGWVLTSVGPDLDLLAPGRRGNSDSTNPLSTAADTNSPARLADINEAMAVSFIEGAPKAPAGAADLPQFRALLERLTYDPTNGTSSDGDLWRVGP
jgi:prepilin-type N-terminal cleavage/methylation domain-containing protein